MTVDELIAELRLCPGNLEVVIDNTLTPSNGLPEDPPPPEDTVPIVSVVGQWHAYPCIISARDIAMPVPPPQAPLSPGEPGQLSPSPARQQVEPEPEPEDEPEPEPEEDDHPKHEPLKASSSTKKKS